MEFPHLGKQCDEPSCNRLDFLPVKCDSCKKVFCGSHMLYVQHNCEAALRKDVQVPVCPLCNQPVPIKRGELPDIRVGEHIDRDCQSDPAKQKRIYVNRCSVKGCKMRELIKVTCSACNLNFCLKHRHPQDHDCQKPKQNQWNNRPNHIVNSNSTNSPSNSNRGSFVSSVQGFMSEDEALARALQLSLNDNEGSPSHQRAVQTPDIDEDLKLAQAIAESDREYRRQQRELQAKKDKCQMM